MPPPTQTFCASGCFKVPAGVHQLCIQAYGGGGGGSGGFFCPCAGAISGGGGGGGGYGKGKVPVTPCATYHVTVGAAGSQNVSGGASSFVGNCSKTVGASGGGHGTCNGTFGCGGTGTGCSATCKLTGCHGHNGGPGGCNRIAGGMAAGPQGGAGGGGNCPGLAPGGGGGGGFTASSAGAHGRVVLTWVCPFSATATASPTSGDNPLTVQFCATPSGGQAPYSYNWNFGTGQGTSTLKNPTHTYATAGSFSPTIRVSDSACDTACPIVPGITVFNNPTIVASITPSSGTNPLATTLKINIQNGDSPFSLSVAFGDGTRLFPFSIGSSSLPFITHHTYSSAGTFNTVITVTDSANVTVQSTIVVTVTNPGGGSCSPGGGGTGTIGSPKAGASVVSPTANRVSQANGIDFPIKGRGIIPKVGLVG